MYGCESWTVKKAERWRIDAFELWCWRRLLRVGLQGQKMSTKWQQFFLPDSGSTCNQSLRESRLPGLWIRVECARARRRRWHPTPVLLAGKSHRPRSLVGCSPWGREALDMTKGLHFHFHALEKEMATHSSVLAWRIPGTGEPGELPSMGSHRVGHDGSDLAAAAAPEQTPKGLCLTPSSPSIFTAPL